VRRRYCEYFPLILSLLPGESKKGCGEDTMNIVHLILSLLQGESEKGCGEDTVNIVPLTDTVNICNTR